MAESLPPDRKRAPGQGRGMALVTQLALWGSAAALAALLHLLTARALGLGFSIFRWGWDSRDLSWRVPIAYALVFSPIAAALFATTLVAGARVAWRAALASWSAAIVFALLLLFPAIHGYASLLLAGGVAAVVSRALARRSTATLWGARLVAAVGTAVTAALALALPARRAEREQRALAALPAPPSGAPNVLLLILDTVRADYTSLYGDSLPTTPFLARWSSQGVAFDESYATAPWTTPSHASLFTGQYPSQHHASWVTPLPPSARTLAEILAERGWATGGFTANFVATRFESGLAQGFIRFEDFKSTWHETLKSTTLTQADNVVQAWAVLEQGGGWRAAARAFARASFEPHFADESHDAKSAAEVRESFLSWRATLPADRPWFAFLNFFDAHAPYRPPAPYQSMFGDPARLTTRYRGGIRYIDDQVQLLVDSLARRGDLANTIVVVTSDHGEQFGEHGLGGHDNSLYRQVLRVPLLVVAPGRVPAGRRITRQVTGRDIPATVLALAGLSADAGLGGTSLDALWRDSSARASDVIAEVDQNMRPSRRFRNAYGPMKALINDSLHVVRDGQGRLEVFAYRRDPRETHDLAAAGDTLLGKALLADAVSRNALRWPTPRPRADGGRP